MVVPEAAVDEDDVAVLGQHEVVLAGQALVVEPVPVTPAPQLGPHNLLLVVFRDRMRDLLLDRWGEGCVRGELAICH